MRLSMIGLLIMLSMVCTGCGGDSHEAITNDMVQVMQEYASTLADVKDVDSAKAASGKLEKIAMRVNEINTRLAELGEADAQTTEAIGEKYQAKYDEVRNEIERNVLRIAMLGPGVTAELDQSLATMQKALTATPDK